MNEISEKDVKRLWVEKDAVCVELKDGRIGRELIRDYEPLRKATRKQLENCRVDCDGVWFYDLDEGLELSGFFSPKKTNPIGRVFWLFPELNASAFARRIGTCQLKRSGIPCFCRWAVNINLLRARLSSRRVAGLLSI